MWASPVSVTKCLSLLELAIKKHNSMRQTDGVWVCRMMLECRNCGAIHCLCCAVVVVLMMTKTFINVPPCHLNWRVWQSVEAERVSSYFHQRNPCKFWSHDVGCRAQEHHQQRLARIVADHWMYVTRLVRIQVPLSTSLHLCVRSN
jgi:hypothetical protein